MFNYCVYDLSLTLNSEGDQMYETIPPITSSIDTSSTSTQVHSNLSRPCTSVADLEDSVFMSGSGPYTASATNLDSHPRTLVKDGFYQVPRSHPTDCHPVVYDLLPSHSLQHLQQQ